MKKIIATILTLCMILGLAGVANAEATTLTMWTFIAQHQEFYESMAKLWNEQNPDRQIDLQVTTIGYDDMHNKYKIALQADEGAPDLCDVELGQFPNVLTFSDKLTDLTPYMQDYMPDLVKARFEIYANPRWRHGCLLRCRAAGLRRCGLQGDQDLERLAGGRQKAEGRRAGRLDGHRGNQHPVGRQPDAGSAGRGLAGRRKGLRGYARGGQAGGYAEVLAGSRHLRDLPRRTA